MSYGSSWMELLAVTWTSANWTQNYVQADAASTPMVLTAATALTDSLDPTGKSRYLYLLRWFDDVRRRKCESYGEGGL